MKKSILSLFFILLFAHNFTVNAAIKGSLTSVSIEPAFEFPAADLDNKMEAFGWFTAGFSLEDNTTSCDFASVYPVSGVINLNGGSLHLSKDLILKNNAHLNSLGFVIGNGHVIELSSTVTALPVSPAFFQQCTLIADNDVFIDSVITFSGNCVVDAQLNTITFGENGAFVVASGATLECRNIQLAGISGTTIHCQDDTATLILHSADWIQNGNATFDQGHLVIHSDVHFLGNYTFSLGSLITTNIETQSMWHISDGMRFEIGKNPLGQWPLTFADHSSILHLDGCNYVINGSGVQILDGTIMYSRDVVVDILSTSTENGSFMGNGDSLRDPIVQFNPGSAAHFVGGHLVWDIVDTTKLRSDSTSVMIDRSGGNLYLIKQNLALQNFTVKSDNSVVTNFIPGKTLTYNKCLFILPGGQIAVTGSRYDTYTSLLSGNNSIFLQYGTLPLATLILGTNNYIQGNGSVSGPLIVANQASNLSLGLEGPVTGPLSLHGGTLSLVHDTRLAGTAVITDSGTVEMNSSRLVLASTGVNWSGDISWVSAGASMVLSTDLFIDGNWLFAGNCTIQGFGNVIDLSNGGTLQVAPGSTLRLQNVRIRGVNGTNIRCIDDTARLVLDQVVWIQDGDFNFENGSLTINDTVDFLGSHTFVYTSKQSSAINVKSAWHITDRMRFTIGKQPDVDAFNPLILADSTSKLQLDNCNFVITHSGWELLRGSIQFSRDVSMDVLSPEIENGVVLGDGTLENDPTVYFDPGCNARFTSGYMVYNIVDQTKLHSDSTTVSMIRLAQSHFLINQNVLLKNFTVDSNELAVTEIADGVGFRYENCVFVLPDGRTQVTASRYDAVSNLLTANDSLFIHNGSMPMATLVLGAGTAIAGTGDLTGPIIFLSPSANLSSGISGSISPYIQLNGATFNLDADLHLKDYTTFTTVGTINLDESQLSLGTKETVWTSTLDWNSNGGSIEMNANVVLTGVWNINGNCSIVGNGNVFDFAKIGSIVVSPGASLTFKDVRLVNILDASITLLDDTSTLTLDSMTWVQASDFVFDKGSFLVKNNVNFNGKYTFEIDTVSTSTLSYNAQLNIAPNMHLLLGRKEVGGADPIYFEDGSSTLRLNNCSFTVSEHGLGLTRGHILCLGDVQVDINSTSTENGLFLGDGTLEGNMVFEFNPGSNVNFASGHAVYDVTVPTCVLSRSAGAILTRGVSSHFVIKQNILLQNLTVDASLSAITDVAPGKTFIYKNATLNVPGGVIVVNAERYNGGTNLMNGDDSIFVTAGSNPMYTVVTGINNYIVGNGAVNGLILLQDAASQLILSVDGLINKDVTLNGGTVVLGQNLHFANTKHFEGDGVIDLAGNQLAFGTQDSTWTHNIIWQGEQGQIDFNANVALSSVWTFSGDGCVLNLNGNTLDLTNGGDIVIQDTAVLHIKNAQIKGVSGSNVRCMSDAGSLVLEDVTWVQNGDFVFERGSMEWKHDNIVHGEATFLYRSAQQSIIDSWSSVSLDMGITFSYDPVSTGTLLPNQHLLSFEDETSSLILRGAKLHAPYGMVLSQGNIAILSNSEFFTDSIEYPIVIGKSLPDTDCKINLGGGVQLKIAQGSLDYRNMSLASWSSGNNLSTLYLAENTVLRLYESLDVGLGRLLFGDATALLRAENKILTGLVTTQGELAFGDL